MLIGGSVYTGVNGQFTQGFPGIYITSQTLALLGNLKSSYDVGANTRIGILAANRARQDAHTQPGCIPSILLLKLCLF